jgi:hypothetical protein
MSNETPTPRTDGAIETCPIDDVVHADFARQLERENAELQRSVIGYISAGQDYLKEKEQLERENAELKEAQLIQSGLDSIRKADALIPCAHCGFTEGEHRAGGAFCPTEQPKLGQSAEWRTTTFVRKGSRVADELLALQRENAELLKPTGKCRVCDAPEARCEAHRSPQNQPTYADLKRENAELLVAVGELLVIARELDNGRSGDAEGQFGRYDRLIERITKAEVRMP